MSGEDLAERAHRAAVEKGFRESTSVPEKIALIHTEVDEFEEILLSFPSALADAPEEQEAQNTVRGATEDAPLEELADVVLRAADLYGHLGLSLPAQILAKTRYHAAEHYRSLRDYPLYMHRAAAKATRAHRQGETAELERQLVEIVALAATLAGILHGYRRLGDAVEKKIEKNLARPRKHERPY